MLWTPLKSLIFGEEKHFSENLTSNVVVELNQVIIKDANLLLFIHKFSKEFLGYAIPSLISLFSSYNKVSLN